jgi:hypothetical protein
MKTIIIEKALHVLMNPLLQLGLHMHWQHVHCIVVGLFYVKVRLMHYV